MGVKQCVQGPPHLGVNPCPGFSCASWTTSCWSPLTCHEPKPSSGKGPTRVSLQARFGPRTTVGPVCERPCSPHVTSLGSVTRCGPAALRAQSAVTSSCRWRGRQDAGATAGAQAAGLGLQRLLGGSAPMMRCGGRSRGCALRTTGDGRGKACTAHLWLPRGERLRERGIQTCRGGGVTRRGDRMGLVPKANPAPGTLWAAATVPHPSRESGGFFQSVGFQGRRKFKTEPSSRPRA